MVSKDRTATQAVSSEDFIGYVVAEDITHIATESVGGHLQSGLEDDVRPFSGGGGLSGPSGLGDDVSPFSGGGGLSGPSGLGDDAAPSQEVVG